MARTTHSARITGPVVYVSSGGEPSHIPLGPCLVEQGDGDAVDIVWGETGQNSAALPVDVLERAEVGGHLVLLD